MRIISFSVTPYERHALEVVQSLVAKLLGKAGGAGQKVFFSIPAPIGGNERGIRHHQESIRQVLTELGDEATPVEQGLAVVFRGVERFQFQRDRHLLAAGCATFVWPCCRYRF